MATKTVQLAKPHGSTENRARESFIPLRKADLVQLMLAQPDLSPADHDDFDRFCKLLEATLHFEFHGKLEELKTSYASFDPDSDTPPLTPLPAGDRAKGAEQVFEQCGWLLERANFRRLTSDEVAEAATAMSHWGINLKVDLKLFERLEVYVRGDAVVSRPHRHWKRLYRVELVPVELHERLVVLFSPKEHDRLADVSASAIHVKLFKSIPKADVDMLLPGTQVQMTLFDQTKIAFPTVSGLAIAGFKLFQGAIVVAAAGFYGLLAYIGLLAGTLGYGAKSFFGYLRTKEKYQLHLTKSLYYQSLASNANVFFRLLDEAEEQEFREAALAYFLLLRQAGPGGWTEEEMDAACEQFLRDHANLDVDFEVSDALVKLERYRLVEKLPGRRYQARSLEAVLVSLDHTWDNYFSYNKAA